MASLCIFTNGVRSRSSIAANVRLISHSIWTDRTLGIVNMFWYGFALGQRHAISADRSPKEVRRSRVLGQMAAVALRSCSKRVALVIVWVVGLNWIMTAGDAAFKTIVSAASDAAFLCAVAPLPAQRDNALDRYCTMWRQ
jgi:hypothetical protein